jgi:hypothetical protein
MALKKFIKDPQAKLDYTLDWSAWLSPFGDSITTATAYVTPTAGLSVGGAFADPGAGATAFSNTATYALPVTIAVSGQNNSLATVWVKGGTSGTSYDVNVKIVTTGGRIDDRTITITCKDM